MNIHEYQAKELLKEYGINVPKGYVIFNHEDAEKTAWSIETEIAVVKAQIHAGGRGKAGGVKIAKSIDEVKTYSRELLGKKLITHQTGPEGKVVNRILIEEGSNIDKEYYLSFVLNRENDCISIIASEEGGVDIEEVAKKSPQKIFKENIDFLVGITDFQARRICQSINIPSELIGETIEFMKKLYGLFVEKDCVLAEINPLVITKERTVIALDAKLNFDENALFRQKDVAQKRDLTEEDDREIEASEHGLSYISLDGNIGCMVNGAGLAMATMDLIKLKGGQPANFLDVGGSATEEAVTEAFKIILSDKKVKGIFVNIFGGIMKCDVVAQGIINAAKTLSVQIPLVIRLEGTNAQLGMKKINESGLNIIAVDSMDEGARIIVEKTK